MKSICTNNRAWRKSAVLLVLSIAVSTLSCTLDKSIAKTPLTVVRTPIFRVWRDFSGSPDEIVLKKIADEIIAVICQHKVKFSGIEVVRFGNGNGAIESELPQKFIWGDAPNIEEFKPNLDNAPAEVKMFQKERDEYIKKQRDEYENNKNQALSEYNGKVEKALKDFYDYFLQEPSVFAPCTKFFSLAERVQKENLSYNLIVTDGWADCAEEQASQIPSFGIAGKLSIIQLTRSKDSKANEQNFKDREKFLQTLFPNAKVFSAYQTTQAINHLVN